MPKIAMSLFIRGHLHETMPIRFVDNCVFGSLSSRTHARAYVCPRGHAHMRAQARPPLRVRARLRSRGRVRGRKQTAAD